jgi:hypothetical protein
VEPPETILVRFVRTGVEWRPEAPEGQPEGSREGNADKYVVKLGLASGHGLPGRPAAHVRIARQGSNSPITGQNPGSSMPITQIAMPAMAGFCASAYFTFRCIDVLSWK